MFQKLFIKVTNQRSYISIAVGVISVAAILLVLINRRFGLGDALILLGIAAALFSFWYIRVSHQTANFETVQRLRESLANGEKPSVIMLYSRYCVGCLAAKPAVDQLEQEGGDRLQVIRLSIDDEPGKTLVKEHEVVYTPTFLYYDSAGNTTRKSTFILDKDRVLRDLEQAATVSV